MKRRLWLKVTLAIPAPGLVIVEVAGSVEHLLTSNMEQSIEAELMKDVFKYLCFPVFCCCSW